MIFKRNCAPERTSNGLLFESDWSTDTSTDISTNSPGEGIVVTVFYSPPGPAPLTDEEESALRHAEELREFDEALARGHQ